MSAPITQTRPSIGPAMAKTVLGALGLLNTAHAILRWMKVLRRRRYYASLLRQYQSPFAQPMESYAAYDRREREASATRARERYLADQKEILAFARELPSVAAGDAGMDRALKAISGHGAEGLSEQVGTNERSGSDRIKLIHAILERLVDAELTPRFYDYDYIEDVVGIIGGRYCSDDGCDVAASASILDALCILATPEGKCDVKALPGELRKLLGNGHSYVPPRADVMNHVRAVIPDMADEFIALKAETNVERFLEINREYSRRQAHNQGVWDNRELSLLRGYERDHHLLLRTLVGLLDENRVSSDDEILLIGPRHIDEVVFFRKFLGLRKTIGLDLFPFGKDEIISGDMHRMPFEASRFKFVYCAGTLSYSYNVRCVIDEIARVAMRPGYVFLVDAGGRHNGPSALGRSDIPTIDAMIGLFYRHRFQVLARDAGRSLAPEIYANEPCLALRLDA